MWLQSPHFVLPKHPLLFQGFLVVLVVVDLLLLQLLVECVGSLCFGIELMNCVSQVQI